MRTRYKLLIAIVGIAELCHYWKLSRRYKHFNNQRLPDVEPEQTEEMIDAVLAKNPDFFERTQYHEHTSHIQNRDVLYDIMRNHPEMRPANKMQIGNANSATKTYQYRSLSLRFFHASAPN